MKKILSLLALVCLSCMGAWAGYRVGTSPISTASGLVDGIYAISVRSNSYSGFMFYQENEQPFRFNNGQGLTAFSASNIVTDNAYLWRITNGDDGFSIQSVSSNEYFSNNSSANDGNYRYHGNVVKVGVTKGEVTGVEVNSFHLSDPAADGDIMRFMVYKTQDGQFSGDYPYLHTNGTGNQILAYWNGGEMTNMNSGSACKMAFYPVEEGDFVAPDNSYFELGKVYRMQLRAGGTPANYPFFYNATSSKVETRNATNSNAFVENRLFYFKKNSNGYTLHCIGAGDDKGFQVTAVSSNDATGSMTTTPSNFVIQTNSNGGFSMKHTGATCHINDVSGNLGVWANGNSSQNDLGSMFTLTEITEADINGTSASAAAKAAAIANPSYTNVAELFRVAHTYTVHVTGAGDATVVVRYGENTYGDTEQFDYEGTLTNANISVEGVPAHRNYTVVINNFDVNVNVYSYYHPLTKVAALESGHKYMIHNATNDNGTDRTGFVYGGASKVTHCGSHPSPLTFKGAPEYLWTVTAVAEGGYTIYNEATGKYYDGSGNAQNSAVTVYIEPWMTTDITKPDGQCNITETFGNVVLKADVTEDQKVFAISGSASGNNGNNCWNGNPETFANWSNSHPWAFYEACEVGATINEDVIDVASDYANYKVSLNDEHTNKYGTYRENTRASVDALTTNSTYAEYETALNAVSSINVIAPAKGSFLRMQGTSGKYISGTAETKSVSGANRRVTTDNAEDAIFWYGTDGALVGYKSGQGFTATCEVAGVGAEMNTQVFGGDASSVAGTLTIISAGSGANTNSYFYDHTDPHGVVNRNGTNHQANCDWIVTDVTSLPVALTQVGELAYASFNAPVAVTVPSGVTAYSAAVNGSVLELTAFEGTNLAANTPVILTAATADTYKFNIVETGTAINDNDLLGTVAKKNVAADKTTYVLNYNSENKIGFYKSTTFVNGFKAYTEADASSESNALSFRFDDVLTAIEAIQSENSSAEIFDLQGRRLTKAQKGMNIINGHKVLVK